MQIYKMSLHYEYVAEGINRVTKSKGLGNLPSRGLGDSLAKVTKATGIKYVVDKISEATGIPCGCEARQNKLNILIPYKQ